MAVKKKTRTQLLAEIEALQAQIEALPFPVKDGDTVYVKATVYNVDPESSSGEVCIEFKDACDGEDVCHWVNLDQLKLES